MSASERIKGARSAPADSSIYIYICIFKGLTPVRLPQSMRMKKANKRQGSEPYGRNSCRRFMICTLWYSKWPLQVCMCVCACMFVYVRVCVCMLTIYELHVVVFNVASPGMHVRVWVWVLLVLRTSHDR